MGSWLGWLGPAQIAWALAPTLSKPYMTISFVQSRDKYNIEKSYAAYDGNKIQQHVLQQGRENIIICDNGDNMYLYMWSLYAISNQI